MELRQKALKGLAWSGTQRWGGRALSFLAFVALSRLLTPEDFGIVAMASLFISFLQTFQDQGLGDAIVQRKDLQDEHLDTAFWTNLLIGCLLTVISIVGSNIIAGIFHEPQLAVIVRWLSLSFVLAGLSSTQQAILRRRFEFKELAARTLFAILAGGVIGVVMAFLGFGVWSLVAQNLISGLVGVIVLWRVSDWKPSFRFSKNHFSELFSFGSYVIGINLLNFLNRHADDLLIGYFLGPTLLGLYTVAYRLIAIMTDLLTSVTNAVAFPAFSRLQNEPERMRRALYQVTQYTSLITFPAFIGVAVIAPELVIAVFGSQWTPSIPVMQVLAFIGILHSLLYFNSSVFMAAGKPAWSFRIAILNAVANVIAFVLVVRWGIVAVAAAYVIRGYLLSPLPVWLLKRIINIELRTYLHQFIAPLVGSSVMAALIIGLKLFLDDRLGLYLRLILFILVGGLAYLLAIRWLVNPVWREIITLIQQTMPRWKSSKT